MASNHPTSDEDLRGASGVPGTAMGRRAALLAAAVAGLGAAGLGRAAAVDAADAPAPRGFGDGRPNRAADPVARVFARARAVPVLRDASERKALRTASIWLDGGAPTVELTTSIPGAFSVARALVRQGAVVGMGTIRDRDDIRRAAAAGVRYVLAPGDVPGMIETARAEGVTPIPGAMTPTEVRWALSAPIVKIFPMDLLSVEYLATLRLLFPGIRLYPNGGFSADPEDARRALAAGAIACGVSAALFSDAASVRAYLTAVQS